MRAASVKLPSLATITITAEPEEIPVRGNALASGDDAEDRAEEDRIIAEAEWNAWAWCTVKVTASYAGLEGTAYLGACSYRDEKDFRAGGYLEGMTDEALEDLACKIESARVAIEALS